MLLEGKVAVIYGGGGFVGGSIARAFAEQGARVFLAGRTLSHLEPVAKDIESNGGQVDIAALDALDETAVTKHMNSVIAAAGKIDISCNVISVEDIQGTPLVEMSLEDFEQPIHIAIRSQFLTARAAAKEMIKRRSGVILTFGGGSRREPVHDYNIGGFVIALSAVDSLRRQLAAELGQYNIRVLTLESGGIMDAVPDDIPEYEDIKRMVVGPTLLQRAATLEDVGNAAVFAASDMSKSMTGAVLNLTCGAFTD